MDLTQFELDSENDPDNICYKSTTVAKYLTLDIILEKNNGISEAQLKRMLYKADFDE